VQAVQPCTHFNTKNRASRVHDFLPHNNEPPTSLRTYPPAHPAYGLCSDSFEHLERRVIDSFGLHRAAQGLRLCEQLNDQLNVQPIGSDGPVRRAFGGVRRLGLQVKVCARKSTGFVRKKRSLNCRVPHLHARMYCLAKWARIFGSPTVGEEGAYSLRRDSLILNVSFLTFKKLVIIKLFNLTLKINILTVKIIAKIIN